MHFGSLYFVKISIWFGLSCFSVKCHKMIYPLFFFITNVSWVAGGEGWVVSFSGLKLCCKFLGIWLDNTYQTHSLHEGNHCADVLAKTRWAAFFIFSKCSWFTLLYYIMFWIGKDTLMLYWYCKMLYNMRQIFRLKRRIIWDWGSSFY